MVWIVDRSLCGILERGYGEGRTDIVWIVEKRLCGILERGYGEAITNILQETEILAVSQSAKLFTSIGKELLHSNCIYGYVNLFGMFCS